MNIYRFRIKHFLLRQESFHKGTGIRISFYLLKIIFFLYHLHLEIWDMEKPFIQEAQVKQKKPTKKTTHMPYNTISISWNFRETKYYTLYILIKRIVQQTTSYENYNAKNYYQRGWLEKKMTMYKSILLHSHSIWCTACSNKYKCT